MNFLELCARLALESGAIGAPPPTVVGPLPRRQAQCVGWVRTAWTLIQNLSSDWTFLRARFEGNLTPGVARYAPGDILAPADAARFSEWVVQGPDAPAMSLYAADIGRKDEQWLRQLSVDRWRMSYDFGVHDPSRPTYWATDLDGSLLFGATPDAAYRVRGEYRRTPQVLAADNDVPEMPARFHDAIWQRAIILMAASDEAVQALQMAQAEFTGAYQTMVRDLLPDISTYSERPLDRR